MKVEGQAIRIRFTHVDGGLVARDGPLKWFQIAGADQQFVDAEATIDGDTIIVKSNKVVAPVAVRYAWQTIPSAATYLTPPVCPLLPSAPMHGTR